MGNSYFESSTLERINVNGDYCKNNCCWVTSKDQKLNKRMYKNNLLGVGNVSEILDKGVLTLKARIQNPSTGKRVCKILSLNGRDYENTLNILLNWLCVKRLEFGYKETHSSEG